MPKFGDYTQIATVEGTELFIVKKGSVSQTMTVNQVKDFIESQLDIPEGVSGSLSTGSIISVMANYGFQHNGNAVYEYLNQTLVTIPLGKILVPTRLIVMIHELGSDNTADVAEPPIELRIGGTSIADMKRSSLHPSFDPEVVVDPASSYALAHTYEFGSQYPDNVDTTEGYIKKYSTRSFLGENDITINCDGWSALQNSIFRGSAILQFEMFDVPE